MKIGIYTGTFDPIHSGHLDFAVQAIKKANLDKVVIIAEKVPYRKRPLTSWDHRQAMIERATNGVERVEHDYEFASSLAKQHTINNVLTQAQKQYGNNLEVWFLVGSDVFEHVHSWQNIVSSKNYGGFITILRENDNYERILKKSSPLKLDYDQLVIVANNHPSTSSSKIRRALINKEPIANVPASVLEYIYSHKLYTK